MMEARGENMRCGRQDQGGEERVQEVAGVISQQQPWTIDELNKKQGKGEYSNGASAGGKVTMRSNSSGNGRSHNQDDSLKISSNREPSVEALIFPNAARGSSLLHDNSQKYLEDSSDRSFSNNSCRESESALLLAEPTDIAMHPRSSSTMSVSERSGKMRLSGAGSMIWKISGMPSDASNVAALNREPKQVVTKDRTGSVVAVSSEESDLNASSSWHEESTNEAQVKRSMFLRQAKADVTFPKARAGLSPKRNSCSSPMSAPRKLSTKRSSDTRLHVASYHAASPRYNPRNVGSKSNSDHGPTSYETRVQSSILLEQAKDDVAFPKARVGLSPKRNSCSSPMSAPRKLSTKRSSDTGLHAASYHAPSPRYNTRNVGLKSDSDHGPTSYAARVKSSILLENAKDDIAFPKARAGLSPKRNSCSSPRPPPVKLTTKCSSDAGIQPGSNHASTVRNNSGIGELISDSGHGSTTTSYEDNFRSSILLEQAKEKVAFPKAARAGLSPKRFSLGSNGGSSQNSATKTTSSPAADSVVCLSSSSHHSSPETLSGSQGFSSASSFADLGGSPQEEASVEAHFRSSMLLEQAKGEVAYPKARAAGISPKRNSYSSHWSPLSGSGRTANKRLCADFVSAPVLPLTASSDHTGTNATTSKTANSALSSVSLHNGTTSDQERAIRKSMLLEQAKEDVVYPKATRAGISPKRCSGSTAAGLRKAASYEHYTTAKVTAAATTRGRSPKRYSCNNSPDADLKTFSHHSAIDKTLATSGTAGRMSDSSSHSQTHLRDSILLREAKEAVAFPKARTGSVLGGGSVSGDSGGVSLSLDNAPSVVSHGNDAEEPSSVRSFEDVTEFNPEDDEAEPSFTVRGEILQEEPPPDLVEPQPKINSESSGPALQENSATTDKDVSTPSRTQRSAQWEETSGACWKMDELRGVSSQTAPGGDDNQSPANANDASSRGQGSSPKPEEPSMHLLPASEDPASSEAGKDEADKDDGGKKPSSDAKDNEKSMSFRLISNVRSSGSSKLLCSSKTLQTETIQSQNAMLARAQVVQDDGVHPPALRRSSARPVQPQETPPGAFAATMFPLSIRQNDGFHSSMLRQPSPHIPTLMANWASSNSRPHYSRSGRLSSNKLVIANQVDGHSSRVFQWAEQITESERTDVDEESTKEVRRLKCRVAMALVIAIAGVLLLVFLLKGDDSDTSKTGPGPTLAPTISMESRVLSLLPEETVFALEDPDTPQSLAYQWLVNDTDNLPFLTDYRIIQRYALATFFFATSGTQWIRNDDWLNYSTHECQWWSRDSLDDDNNTRMELQHNSPCEHDPKTLTPFDEEGVFKHLWLRSNNLVGKLPSELFLLSGLRSINMDVGGLEGTIPSQFSQLSALEHLSLASNALTGSIPQAFYDNTKLQSLFLQYNKLTGTISSHIGQLTNLEIMLLDGNAMDGTIPTDIGKLQSLVFLYAFGMRLGGPLPSELGQLNRLRHLAVDENSISGSIPTELGNCANMTGLWLHANQLVGTLPPELGNLYSLEHLVVANNSLTGIIPPELEGLLVDGSLNKIDVRANDFSGVVPDVLCYVNTLLFDCNKKLCGCDCDCV